MNGGMDNKEFLFHFERVNGNGYGIGNFHAGEPKHFFPDHFRGNKFFRHVGQGIFRKKPWSLWQALLNLIVNASQAMENKTGQPQIHIKSWMEGEDIFVSVKDTGPGVPPNMGLRIFEAFYTTKGKNGNGIGLAAVSDIMSRHNGEITLEQNDDRGACFKMRFPAR